MKRYQQIQIPVKDTDGETVIGYVKKWVENPRVKRGQKLRGKQRRLRKYSIPPLIVEY